MPRYVTPLPGTSLANEISQLQQPTRPQFNAVSPKAEMTVGGMLGYGLMGIGLGALDTMGQSFNILGEDDVTKTLDAVAPGSFGDFYKTNREGLRIGGELITMPIPGMISLKGLRTAQWALQSGRLSTYLKNSTTAEALLGSSARLAASEQALISRAILNKETTGTFAGRTFDNPAIRAAKKSFVAERVVNTAREAAAFELAYRAFYNKSELLEPSEYNAQDELAWAGFGIGLGATIGFVQARYAARALIKAAPELSPTAAASLRELRVFANKDIGNVVSLPQHRGPLISFFARTKELTTAAITDAASPALKTNLQQDLNSFDKIIKESVTDLGRDLHPFVNSFQMSDEQAALGITALAKNPLLFLFSPKIGQLDRTSQSFYDEITSELDRLQKYGLRLESRIARTMTKSRFQRTADKKLLIRTDAQKKLAENKEKYDALNTFSTQHHFVIESWGDITPYRQRPDNWLDNRGFGAIVQTKWRQTEADITNPGLTVAVQHSRLSIGGKGSLTLDDRFILEGGEYGNLSAEGWSQVNAMGSKMIAEWSKVPNQVFPVTPSMPRFQLEAIMTLGRENKEAASLIKLGGDFHSLKDVEFHILNEKYKEWLAALPSTERKTRGARDLLSRTVTSPEELIDSLNLPRNVGVQPNALIEIFTQAKAQGAKSLSEIFKKTNNVSPNADHPLDLLQSQMRQAVGVTDNAVQLPTSGNMLRQKNVRPLLVVSEAVPQMGIADALIHARVIETQKLALERLGQVKTPIVSGVLQHVASASAISQAKDVTSLHDAVASGRGIFVPQDRINEQYEAIKAVSLLSQDSDNFVLAQIRKIFDTKLSGMYAELRHKKNYTHLVDASRVEHSYRHGWDIAGVEYQPDGKSAQFLLAADSEQNQKLMQRHFKTDVVKGQKNYMPDMSVSARKAGAVPLRVTKMAADFMDEVSRLSRGAGEEDNALRIAKGRHAIQLRDWHLPSPELSMQDAWFVRNEIGDVVDLYHKGTEAQNKARALAAAEKLGGANAGSKFIAASYESTRLLHQWSDDPMHFINYSDQWLKTGAAIEGGSAVAEIDRTSTTIDKMVNTLAQQYVNVGTRARAAIFEPQIRFAREASLYAGKPAGLAVGENNIFDRYLAQLYSRTTQSGSGFVSRGYKLFENAYDAALTYLHGVKSEALSTTVEGQAAARGLKRLVQDNVSDSEFKQYQKLQSWSPFDSTAEWLESTHKEIDTSFARRHAVALSKASATMSLRFLDIGTPLLNYLGLMTNTYPIIRAMRPKAGQNFEEWVTENAAWGSKLSSKNIITLSPMRAMVSSISNFWTGKHLKRLERAAAEGMFDPEWLRLEQAMVVPPKRKGAEWAEKAAEWTTMAADRSEIHSRRIAFGLGLDLGESMFKIEDDRNLMIFATNFMNNMIGNYNPRNKPGMYQGAVGLPLGAFMTYMFNYYKRMYGYLEKGEWSTLAAQYAVQSSIFGAQSVPGWSLFNQYMFSNYDGSDNLTTRLDRKLSPGVAELVLHGSLSGIPAIFGVDAPAFYPRGSVDMTQLPVTPADWQRAPPVVFLKSLWDGASATLGNVVAGFNVQQQEEIFANYSTNRAIKSIMEGVAGAKVDRAGRKVDASVRDFASVAAALVGTVPSSARAIQDRFNAQQAVEVNQAEARSKLNDHTRAALRSGNFDMADLQGMVFQYVKSGGNPAYFGTWLRNNVEAAFFPKGERKLLELSRGANWIEFTNMLAAMNMSPGAEQ